MRTLITRGFAICPTLLVALSAKDDGTQVLHIACFSPLSITRPPACLHACVAPLMCQQRMPVHATHGCCSALNTACLPACPPAVGHAQPVDQYPAERAAALCRHPREFLHPPPLALMLAI
jgi:hypothetical protein